MGASSAARAARIAAELDGMPYLRLLSWDDRRRDGVRMFLAHASPEQRLVFKDIADDCGCKEEALIDTWIANGIQGWMGGKD